MSRDNAITPANVITSDGMESTKFKCGTVAMAEVGKTV